ncbi:MAG: prenyltransferase/squalene oxidase repeat-containing protein [Bacteroidota bacterium]
MMDDQSASTDTKTIPPDHILPQGLTDISLEADASLQRMISWLTAAPVRNLTAGRKDYGSFSHGVHDKTGHSPGQYTEITGYGVSVFAHLFRWREDEKFLQGAIEAADFLLSIQLDSGAYPHCPDPLQSCANGEQYTFDTSMCTMGIMDLYHVHKEQKYLDSAIRAGDWLLSMQREDGGFLAKATAQAGNLNTGNFFGDGSCIHVKNAMALLKLAEYAKAPRFAEGARKVCDYVLGLQREDGMFWSMPSKNFVFTHAHCYACEGFISAGAYLGEERYTEAALRGVAWLQQVQNEDGSVYQVYEDSRKLKRRARQSVHAFKAADATSQSARLFALAGSGYTPNYKKAIAFVKEEMQSESGGLHYIKGRFRTDYMMYTWPTMFAIQAIEFAHRPISARDLF